MGWAGRLRLTQGPSTIPALGAAVLGVLPAPRVVPALVPPKHSWWEVTETARRGPSGCCEGKGGPIALPDSCWESGRARRRVTQLHAADHISYS